MTVEGVASTSQEPCKVCGEPLHPGAMRCTKCQAYKDWRGFMAFTGILLPQVQTAILIIVGLWTFGGHYDWFTNPHGHSRTSVLAVRLGQPDENSGKLKTLEADLVNEGRNYPSHIVGCKIDFQGRLDTRVLALSGSKLELGPRQLTTIQCRTLGFGKKGKPLHEEDLAWLQQECLRPTLQIDIQESSGESTPLFVSLSPSFIEPFVRDSVDLKRN
jgi:hypothetical protein